MQPTERQLEASRVLGEAIARFLVTMAAAEAPRTPSAPPEQAGDVGPARLLVNPREAAKLLAISSRTLWGLTAPHGPILAVRLGRLVCYSPADLAKAIKHITVRGRAPRPDGS